MVELKHAASLFSVFLTLLVWASAHSWLAEDYVKNKLVVLKM